jgi:hypothetical protein
MTDNIQQMLEKEKKQQDWRKFQKAPLRTSYSMIGVLGACRRPGARRRLHAPNTGHCDEMLRRGRKMVQGRCEA